MCHYGVENAPIGRFFFRGFMLGILQPHRNTAGIVPSFFAVNETGARGEVGEEPRTYRDDA